MGEEAIATGKERLGEFMDPWQGALSSLYAVVSNEACGGNLYEPDNREFRGYPALATINEIALDRTVANKFWNLAEQITVYCPEICLLFYLSTTFYRWSLRHPDLSVPTTDYRLPTTDLSVPTTDYQLPTTDYQLPTSSSPLIPF